MNIDKFKKRLTKLNTIFNSFAQEDELSTLEKDLLKKYVFDLYEVISESTGDRELKEELLQRTAHTPVTVVTPEVKEEPKVEPVIEKTAPVVVKPVEIKAEPKVSVPVTETVVETPTPATVVTKKQESLRFQMPAELSEIFEQKKITELSDRLSFSRVDDISKAMGINEKIFTIKELFDGDQGKFDYIISRLNDCKSYDEAVEILATTVAEQEKWASEDKVNKAKQFVKLVQRKFS